MRQREESVNSYIREVLRSQPTENRVQSQTLGNKQERTLGVGSGELITGFQIQPSFLSFVAFGLIGDVYLLRAR